MLMRSGSYVGRRTVAVAFILTLPTDAAVSRDSTTTDQRNRVI